MAAWRKDEDDDLDDTEDPDLSDQDSEDEESTTVPCPRCRRDVYEDADRCPHCGQYITADATAGGKPLWLIIAAVLALLAVVLWLAF